MIRRKEIGILTVTPDFVGGMRELEFKDMLGIMEGLYTLQKVKKYNKIKVKQISD